MAVAAVAGAGAQAISWLLGVPGASRTVLEAVVPYASTSLVEFVEHKPDQVVSAQTASEMARSAYERAVHLKKGDVPVVGVACTAAIATDRRKRGAHRCHAAAWNEKGVTTYSVEFIKGLRDRTVEDTIASKLVLRALAEASGVEAGLQLDLAEGERVDVRSTRYDDPIKALLADHIRSVVVRPDSVMRADDPVVGGVLPGSFDPFHEGHQRLAMVASNMLGADVTFELSITNVDKPTLEEREVRSRLAQSLGGRPVVVTRAPVFYEKARLFPGCAFVIGWDTALRLVDPQYYGGDESKMLDSLFEMRRLGCRFVVAGRAEGGVFRTLEDVSIPWGLENMFAPIPESAFRSDVSSTGLRTAGRPV